MPCACRLSLVLALAAGGAACTSDGHGPEAVVCRAVEREVLVDEELLPDTPSSAFGVEADDDVWVAVTTDHDVSPSALFSRVTGLWVIDAGAPVEYTRTSTGRVETDAPHLGFDEQDQFVPLGVEPGAYQLWSTKTPGIQVVRCPTNAD